MQPLHSSTIEHGAVHYPVEQSLIMPSIENELHSVHLLRPRIGKVMGPSTVNNAIPIQSAAKLPVFSVNNGVTDGNKTLHMMSSFNTGMRYKRKTNLKFSEGSVDAYEIFRSQFNIHHKMLGWDIQRAGIELYMNLDDLHTYDEFEHIFAYRDSNHQNRFKNETCTYCNKKGLLCKA